ncbi:MAG: hypothetical protein HOD85_09260 [Deltaproteobacteria bacterium]|jgi:hypothetical protein|nr:hypothetical protein [Deltaproteobacteria bacterium]MBT4643047.1 hypothetical protein [Deltaproteobacteria bacterium]
MERDFAHSILYDDFRTILLQQRKELKRFFSVPTLIIDADADKRLIEKCFGKSFRLEEIRIRMLTTVTQCYSKSFYNLSMIQSDKKSEKANREAKELIKEINGFIEMKSESRNQVLTIAPLKVEEQLRLPENCESIHFNAFRGLDKYSSCDGVIGIGRNQMKVSDLERLGRAMFYDDDEELKFNKDEYLPKERRRYSTKDPSISRSVQVSYHPDERIDSILKQTRECETTQGIHRIRPLRAEEPNEIILLCNVPVDLEIDRLVDWTTLKSGETKIDEMRKSIDFDSEVIPFTYDYFTSRFNDLWTTKGQFRSALRSSSVTFKSLLVSIIENNTRLNSYLFKRLDSQVKYLPVLSPFGFLETTQKLEAMYGCEVKLKAAKSEIAAVESIAEDINDLEELEETELSQEEELCSVA